MGLLFGLVGAIIVAAIVVVLRVPKYLIILLTAIGGALAAIAGRGLDLQAGHVEELTSGIIGPGQAVRDLAWLWAGAVVVLAVVGIVYQMPLTAQTEEAIMYGSYRNPGMTSGSSY